MFNVLFVEPDSGTEKEHGECNANNKATQKCKR